ncbi:glycosyltransferase family 4 protein [Haliea sp. AH-315-K21]|nr:glycosyltransferase family 4 protein [Haliea sp. AH-315-K21]MBN4075958.1 glycosyltransferase family 4 protein [Gammaproteobacteria bacterium AH-315-E17]
MKFAIVLYSYFPFGGLQQDLLKILQACRARQIEVTILCMEWEGDKPDNTDVVVLPCQGYTKTALRESFVEKMLEATLDKFDLVLGFNKMPGLDYYYAADYCFAEKARNERSFLYRLTSRAKQYMEFEKAVFGREQDTVSLLLTPQQREEFIRHYQTEKERLILLPPGIKKDRKAESDAPIKRRRMRHELLVAQDELLLLQIGSSFKTKGLIRSMLAFAALPEALRKQTRFVVVGEDAPEKYLKEALRLGIEKRFKIINGSNQVPELLLAADLLIHPSLKESAGMVLLEAIVAGLPVLTTSSCGYAYHVQRAQAGVVCPMPFQQEYLNQQLEFMLLSKKRDVWKTNGIAYGQEQDLYSMPQTVVNLLVQAAQSYSQ